MAKEEGRTLAATEHRMRNIKSIEEAKGERGNELNAQRNYERAVSASRYLANVGAPSGQVYFSSSWFSS